uniref:protein-serine/threonine phosphatase n=1 Tax=Oryza nivara TaxID=4536 RepID=A0A0E0G9N3_ORYNI
MERIRELIELDLDALRNTSFFGVYDGDGGAEVAMYCAKRFHAMLCEDENYLNNLPNAITSVCSRLDDDLQRSNEWKESLYPRGNGECFQFLKTGVCANLWHSEELGFMLPQQAYRAPLYEGSTACVVIIRGNQITVGNVGDSRCVVSHNGQAIDLSIDHKPTVGSERERILRAGGRVLVKRIPVMGSDGRLMRGWGYFELKKNQNIPASQQMVTCDPEFTIVDITADTEFLVIATDGIWGHMSSQDVVDFIRKELHSGEENLRAICEKLLDHCLTSRDNVTVILVRFKPGAAVIPILSDIDEEPVLSDVEEEPHEPQQNPGDGGGGGGGQQDIGGESEELPLAHFPQEYSNSSAPLPMFDSFSGGGTPPIDTDTFLRAIGALPPLAPPPEAPLAPAPPDSPHQTALPLFHPFSGGATPQMVDTDTFLRAIGALPPLAPPPAAPLAPAPPDSPRTPHTYGSLLPVYGDLPPLTGAVVQEPLPLPEGGDHPEPPKKKIKVAPLLPERADQPVVTSNSATTTRPQLCAPYDDEIEATLRAMETNPAERPSPYFLETTQGGRMTALVRASMIAFMDEFSQFHELADGTLQRAAYFLDRYLSVTPESDDALQLRLVGATAVFLAAKYEDQYTLRKIDASMVAARCGYTSETRHKMVSIMETEMLAALGFNLGGPTAYTFVEHFTRYYGDGKKEKLLKEAAHRFADGSLLTYGFHRYLPSVVAASAIFLARLDVLGHEPWSQDLAELTGYKAIDLMGCPYVADLLADDITASMVELLSGDGGAAQMDVGVLDAYLRAIGALPAHPAAPGADLAAAAEVESMASNYDTNGVLYDWDTKVDVKVPCALLPPPPGFPPLPVPGLADEPVYAAPARRLPPPPGFPPLPVPAKAEPVYAAPVDEGDAIRAFMQQLEWSEQYNGDNDAPAPDNSTASRPQLCAPYDDDIDANLRDMEKDAAQRPSPDYLDTVQGGQISAAARASLVAWMGRLTHRYELAAGTLHRAVSYFDRFLSVRALPCHVADRSLESYGCLGYLPSVVAAAVISIARWTLNPPGALPWSSELHELTGYSSQHISSCVLTVLNTQ